MAGITFLIQRHTRAPHTTHHPHRSFLLEERVGKRLDSKSGLFFFLHHQPSLMQVDGTLPYPFHTWLDARFRHRLLQCCVLSCMEDRKVSTQRPCGSVQAWPVNRPAVRPWDFWAGSVERIPDVVWAPYESLFAEGVAVFLTTPYCWDSWGLGRCR